MSNIKKVHQEVYNYLLENEEKKVKSILPQIVELMASKANRSAAGENVVYDNQGKVVGLRCWHSERYMPLVGPEAVEFGSKASSASGYNTMCKEALRDWTKKQNDAHKAKEALLAKIVAVNSPDYTGNDQAEYSGKALSDKKEKIEAARSAKFETSAGFQTKEELIRYLEQNGVTVGDAPVKQKKEEETETV